MTLWGLSRLGVQVPERAVALLLQGALGAAALYGTLSPPPPLASPPPSSSSPAASAPLPPPPSSLSPSPGSWSGRAVGPGDLAGVALVLAHCRHVPPRRWLVRFCAAVSRQLPLFRPRCAGRAVGWVAACV
jgi:hypothetical protein